MATRRRDAHAHVERLRALYAAQATHQQAGAAIGASPMTAFRLARAAGLATRRRGLEPRKRQRLESAILAAEETCARLAERYGVSSRTAWLYKRRLGVARRVRKYLCTCGRLLNIKPCQFCRLDKGK